MREIPPTLQAKLDEGATTLAHCWRIDPEGRPPLGFTDHDVDLEFGGVVFEAASGFAASAVEASLGLAADNASATGALRSDRISEADLRAGLYDGAEVRLWLVDWQAPGDRVLLFRGEIGETRRGALAFEAEVRGLGERLNRPVCRRFLGICDARLGDSRCGVDLAAAGLRASGEVVAVRAGRALLVSGLSDHAAGAFRDGEIRWSSGALAGRTDRVRGQRRIDDLVELTLAATPFPEPAPGDGFEAVAGCDKSFATCRDCFGNAVNFRGFPFTPGESWLTARQAEGRPHEGGSLVR